MKPKNEIPWRKRRNEAQSKSPSIGKEPWMTKAVTRAQAIGAAIATFLAWVLLNGVTALQNAEQLPDAYIKTRDSILSRYYNDSSWTGVWSSNPEGYIDTGDVTLSSVDIYLQLRAAQGSVEGTIATRNLCTQLPFAMDGVLFKGEVSGKAVRGLAYDYIGGKQVQLALVSIKQDAEDPSILTVHVTEDGLRAFPSEARIRSELNKKPMDAQSNGSLYCEPIRYPQGRTNTKKRRPIAELHQTLPPAH